MIKNQISHKTDLNITIFFIKMILIKQLWKQQPEKRFSDVSSCYILKLS